MNISQHSNGHDIINSIRLQLRHPSGAEKIWIIVEGVDDVKLFSKLINAAHVNIETPSCGVNGVLQSVSELLHETDRIVGIRDADFLHLDGERGVAQNKNIFLTNFHDAEIMLISCDRAYNSVMAEYLTHEENPFELRWSILKSIAFISGIRWINNSEDLELKFKNLGFGKFYNGQTALLDEEKCLTEILNRSPNKRRGISIQDVNLKIQDVSDFLNLCNGHDFQKAFALYITCNLTSRYNSTSKKGVSHSDIAKAFRLAYGFDDFQKTHLYRQLKEWADSEGKTLFGH